MYTMLINQKQRLLSLSKTFRKDLSAWLLIAPSLFFFVVFAWQPLISSIVLSFFETKGYSPVKFIGFGNYDVVISDSAFLKALANSFSYTLWSIIIGFAFPIIIAIIINEMVHLKSLFKFAAFFPTMIPGIAAALLWMFLFDPGPGGLLNIFLNMLGIQPSQWLQNPRITILLIIITMTWRGFGGAVLIYLASLQGIKQDLYEASDIDGAGILTKVREITIPQIFPTALIMFILQIIGVFQVMYEPLAMTDGGPNNASLSLMLQGYFYAFRYFEAGRSMAVGVIVFVILLVLNIFYFKVKKTVEE